MWITSHRPSAGLAALAAALALLCGCSTGRSSLAAETLPGAAAQACPASQVRYCIARGTQGDDGLCMCLSQGAAQASLQDLSPH